MCTWGTTKYVTLCRPTPVQQRTTIKVDACIAPLIQILSDYGVEMTASCCGHRKVPGRIDLADGQIIWLPCLEKM